MNIKANSSYDVPIPAGTKVIKKKGVKTLVKANN
jgi:hypothetical protein